MSKNITNYNRSINDGKGNYYTKIDDRLIKTKYLSCDEKMIMIFCLSQNDSYVAIKQVIQKQLNLGERSFKKAWKSLERFGCIEDCGQIIINGQFGPKQFTFNEYPDKLKKLDGDNTKQYQEVTDNDCKEDESTDTVGSFVHSGEVFNGKEFDDYPMVDETHNDKVTSNKYQNNQDQDNQDQFNNNQQSQKVTNDFDENQNSLIIPSYFSESLYEYMQIAKDYIEDYQCNVFHSGWYAYEREIKTESERTKIYFLSFDDHHAAWIINIYKWILFINERLFKCNIDYWRIGERDITDLYLASTNSNLRGEGWKEAFQIMNTIAEKAYYSEADKITVSYLTKQLRRNSCLVEN